MEFHLAEFPERFVVPSSPDVGEESLHSFFESLYLFVCARVNAFGREFKRERFEVKSERIGRGKSQG